MATVLLFSLLGWLIASFIGWLLMAPPKPQDVRMRVASNGHHVIIALKVGNEVQLIKVNR